jgi:hypothetical protein
MQAHPQSIPAARISFTPSHPPLLTPSPASPTLSPPAAFLLAAVPDIAPAEGIAQSTGLAHDAGNLLGALGLYCDLLSVPGVLRPEHLHYATELGLISSRSSELIRRLLEIPPPQPVVSLPVPARPSPICHQTSPPTEILRPGLAHASVLRHLAPVLERIAAGAARVSVSTPAALPPFDVPPETLERITVNLVRNAAEAIRNQHACEFPTAPHAPGEIRVVLVVVAGRLQLTIDDNGPGVPPSVAAAFLRPAVLPPNTRRGLGHRIIHDLVTASGGQLSIRVRPGQGTAFCVKWPLPLAADAGPAAPLIAIPTPPPHLATSPAILPALPIFAALPSPSGPAAFAARTGGLTAC